MKKTWIFLVVLMLTLFLVGCKKETPLTFPEEPAKEQVAASEPAPAEQPIASAETTPAEEPKIEAKTETKITEKKVECGECQYLEGGVCNNYMCCDDSDCDDGLDTTMDTCSNPMTKNAECSYKLIRNYCDAEKCDSNEICIEGNCVKAPINLVFINSGFKEEEFQGKVEELVSAFVSASPLKECPEQVKVHKLSVCCPEGEDIATCAEKYISEFDVVILLHPFNVFEEGCSARSSTSKSIITIDCTRAFTHEMGHAIAKFADQYCLDAVYEGNTINPVTDDEGCWYSPIKREFTCRAPGVCWNRETHESKRLEGGICMSNEECENEYGSNFECVSCYIPQDTWEWNYCSQFHNPPIYCMGNPTPSNSRSIMGIGGGGPGDLLSKIEFDENEYNILKDKLVCR